MSVYAEEALRGKLLAGFLSKKNQKEWGLHIAQYHLFFKFQT